MSSSMPPAPAARPAAMQGKADVANRLDRAIGARVIIPSPRASKPDPTFADSLVDDRRVFPVQELVVVSVPERYAGQDLDAWAVRVADGVTSGALAVRQSLDARVPGIARGGRMVVVTGAEHKRLAQLAGEVRTAAKRKAEVGVTEDDVEAKRLTRRLQELDRDRAKYLPARDRDPSKPRGLQVTQSAVLFTVLTVMMPPLGLFLVGKHLTKARNLRRVEREQEQVGAQLEAATQRADEHRDGRLQELAEQLTGRVCAVEDQGFVVGELDSSPGVALRRHVVELRKEVDRESLRRNAPLLDYLLEGRAHDTTPRRVALAAALDAHPDERRSFLERQPDLDARRVEETVAALDARDASLGRHLRLVKDGPLGPADATAELPGF